MFIRRQRDRDKVLLHVLARRLSPLAEVSGNVDVETVSRVGSLFSALTDIFRRSVEGPYLVSAGKKVIAASSTHPRYVGSVVRVICTGDRPEAHFVIHDASVFPLDLPCGWVHVPGMEQHVVRLLDEIAESLPRGFQERYMPYIDLVREVIDAVSKCREGETVYIYLDTPVLKSSTLLVWETHVVENPDREEARELAEAVSDLGWSGIMVMQRCPRDVLYVFSYPATETRISVLVKERGDVYVDMSLGRDPEVDVQAAAMLGGRETRVRIYVDTGARARLWREWERLLTYLYRRRIFLERVTLE